VKVLAGFVISPNFKYVQVARRTLGPVPVRVHVECLPFIYITPIPVIELHKMRIASQTRVLFTKWGGVIPLEDEPAIVFEIHLRLPVLEADSVSEPKNQS